MARANVRDKPIRCKHCPAYDRVSLTLEWCRVQSRPLLGEDIACKLLTGASLRATKSDD